tara:strand:- start:1487 stop:2545 length:1059 start_codon:yes stop_codon:yes gene_type:complete
MNDTPNSTPTTPVSDEQANPLDVPVADNQPSRQEMVEEASYHIRQLEKNIAKVLIGQTDVLREILIAFLAGGHVLLEGLPGLGKTLMVKAIARATHGRFSRIQFTPDLMPSDVTGHTIYDMSSEQFKLRRGPVFCNLLLADEINRAPAKTQSALLEVMQEQQVTLEGKSLPLSAPFMVLATQNPIEQEGTYPLPEAQLDRFLFKTLIDYPTADEEFALAQLVTSGKSGDKLNVESVEQQLYTQQVIQLQQLASHQRVDDQVLRYAVNLVRTTREWPGIALGSGPRGVLAIIRAAKALSLINKRDFVIPDDIKQVARPALRHRIQLSAEMEIEGYTQDRVLSDVINKVEAPRL